MSFMSQIQDCGYVYQESEAAAAGGASGDVRQPVPGVLMMDYHQRTGQPTQPNGQYSTY